MATFFAILDFKEIYFDSLKNMKCKKNFVDRLSIENLCNLRYSLRFTVKDC